MKLKVSLVIPTLDRGGAEKQLVTLATGLDRDRFDARVVTLTRDGPMRSILDDAGIPVDSIGKAAKFDPSAYVRLRRLFRRDRPEIVHTWIFAANAYGRSAALAAGVPVVIGSERSVDPWKRTWHRYVDAHLARRSTAMTTNSRGVVDFYAGRGIDPSLFRVIPNGIDPAVPPAIPRDEVARRLGLDTDRRWIFSIGRLWPQKNYRDLIWSAELLGCAGEPVTLVIIGDGPQRDELIRHRDALSTPRHVVIAGHHDNAASMLKHADVFWIGSRYEGQSNAVMEAMRAGVPVIASDIPGNRDLVVDQKTGVIVPLCNPAARATATRTILHDRSMAEAMGQSSKHRIANEFTIETMIQSHQTLYQTLAERSRAATLKN